MRSGTICTNELVQRCAWLGGTPVDPGHPGDRAAHDVGVPFLVSGLGHERLNR